VSRPTDTNVVTALRIALRALKEIDASTQHQSHGVSYLGDVAAKALWDIGELVQ
jgi:hypothetical protein